MAQKLLALGRFNVIIWGTGRYSKTSLSCALKTKENNDIMVTDMLDTKKIAAFLSKKGTNVPKITYYPLTDSTNERAKVYATEHPSDTDAHVFIAEEQSAGRGRRGRSFVSKRGSGIFITVLIHPKEKGADATRVTAKAAVALALAVERVCGVRTDIKWVNDIFLGGKKLAGILVEGSMATDGNLPYIIVGMGTNVYKNAISEEISHIATSIESEAGKRIDRNVLAAEIIHELLRVTEELSEEEAFFEYRSRSFVIGQEVTVMKLSGNYPARVLDLNPDYSLLIEKENGETESLFTGEVSLKINN